MKLFRHNFLKYNILFVLFAVSVSAQNLIPNGGFEDYLKLPDADGCFNGYIQSWSNLNGKVGYPNATPDFLHRKGTGNGKVESYYYGKVEPYKGDAMMGVIVMPDRSFYEYVSTNVALKKGKRYEFSLFITNGAPKYCKCSGKGFGVYFSAVRPQQNVAELVKAQPQWKITDNFHSEKWEQISFRFTAQEDYSFITLGYFNDPKSLEMKSINGQSSDCIYFFVDEISLIEIDNDPSNSLVNIHLPDNIKNIQSNLNVSMIAVAEKKVYTLKVDVSVHDKKTNQPIPAEISLVDVKANKEVTRGTVTKEQPTVRWTLPDATTQYGIFAKSKGYVDGSEKVGLLSLAEDRVITKEISLSPLQKGATIVLKNIYFETGKFELLEESFAELDKLSNFLKENPTVKIEISGHTDSIGNDVSNQELSKNRANAVRAYLGKTIQLERMTAVGFGKAKPVSSNDTPEGRQMNRRVEFKIL